MGGSEAAVWQYTCPADILSRRRGATVAVYGLGLHHNNRERVGTRGSPVRQHSKRAPRHASAPDDLGECNFEKKCLLEFLWEVAMF